MKGCFKVPDRTDFEELVNLAMAIPGRTHMRPVVEKELLHYDILFCLDQEGLLDQLTFQGGTALRLCHGSSRFSEDLDFAGGKDFASHDLQKIRACIEKYIQPRYGLEVEVKEPRDLQKDLINSGLNISKWQLSVTTAPERRDIPRQRVKIEVASVPAWTREPRALQVNYNFLPDGYADTLVMTEKLDEIMADKLISLVNTERYVRNRDIWDLRWLKQNGAVVDARLANNKIHDYRISDYPGKLEMMLHRIPEIIHGAAFKDEMLRFIPEDVQDRTLKKEKFYDFLESEIRGLLEEVRSKLLGVESNDPFKM
jgi:predicted nucleotidyltransferase component of viral defense system